MNGYKFTNLSVFPYLTQTSSTYALADKESNTAEGFYTSFYLYEAERLYGISTFPTALKPSGRQSLAVSTWIFNPANLFYDNPSHIPSNAPSAQLGDMKLDRDLNVYVTHPDLNRLLSLDSRHADFIRSYVEKFAGSTQAGLKDGVGDEAQFQRPAGLALDSQRNVYVADMGNHAIRKITQDRTVTTIYPKAR